VHQTKITKNESLKIINIINQQLIYPAVLILSTARKPFEALASLAGKSCDTFYQLVREKSFILKDLVNIAIYTLTKHLLACFE
jgi:hypothetical protein